MSTSPQRKTPISKHNADAQQTTPNCKKQRRETKMNDRQIPPMSRQTLMSRRIPPMSHHAFGICMRLRECDKLQAVQHTWASACGEACCLTQNDTACAQMYAELHGDMCMAGKADNLKIAPHPSWRREQPLVAYYWTWNIASSSFRALLPRL